MSALRASDDNHFSPVKLADEDFDGLTKAEALRDLLYAHDREMKELGQVVPKPRRGLGRLFGPLVSALGLQVLLWSGTPNTPQQSAVIMAQGHWSKSSPSVAPLPEGVIGERLFGTSWYYPSWYFRGGYYGHGGYRGGYRGGRR